MLKIRWIGDRRKERNRYRIAVVDDRRIISARTCCTKKLSYHSSFLLVFARRSNGSAGACTTIHVLLLFLGWLQYLDLISRVFWGANRIKSLPGTNTTNSHQRSSWHQHCQIRHSNLARWTESPIAALRKIHSRLRQLDELYKSGPYHASGGTWRQRLARRWMKHLGRSHSNQLCPCQDQTTADHREDRSRESIFVS